MGGGGGFFYNGGWDTFKVSLHSWQRGANTLFYEDPILPTPFFSNYVNKQNNHTYQTFRER